jgi:hypothetical protein
MIEDCPCRGFSLGMWTVLENLIGLPSEHNVFFGAEASVWHTDDKYMVNMISASQ